PLASARRRRLPLCPLRDGRPSSGFERIAYRARSPAARAVVRAPRQGQEPYFFLSGGVKPPGRAQAATPPGPHFYRSTPGFDRSPQPAGTSDCLPSNYTSPKTYGPVPFSHGTVASKAWSFQPGHFGLIPNWVQGSAWHAFSPAEDRGMPS